MSHVKPFLLWYGIYLLKHLTTLRYVDQLSFFDENPYITFTTFRISNNRLFGRVPSELRELKKLSKYMLIGHAHSPCLYFEFYKVS